MVIKAKVIRASEDYGWTVGQVIHMDAIAFRIHSVHGTVVQVPEEREATLVAPEENKPFVPPEVKEGISRQADGFYTCGCGRVYASAGALDSHKGYCAHGVD